MDAQHASSSKRSSRRSRGAGRTILTELESKQVLEAYGIPAVRRRSSRRTEAEAVGQRPGKSAIPVVLKLYSETITHKTDVGGVQLNLGRRRGGGARLPRASRHR